MSPSSVHPLTATSPHELGTKVRLASGADPALHPEAIAVRDALIRRGLETPLVENQFSAEQKRQSIEEHFCEIMQVLGLDLRDDSLADTPRRIARMYVNEIFGGLDYRNFPRLTVVPNTMQVAEMIRVDNVSLLSTCEHHFVTIDGVATVAYIPRHKIIGLSKINRVVAFFARRPQIQERLTEQILLAMQTLLETDEVAVRVTAVHYCVKARGVQDGSSRTTTLALGGSFKSCPARRKEFLAGPTAS